MIDLMSKQEVCKYLRCAPRTFDRWRSMWKARGVDVGEVRIRRRILFRFDKIEKLVATPKLWLAST
jgi:hypothetical protein